MGVGSFRRRWTAPFGPGVCTYVAHAYGAGFYVSTHYELFFY